MLAYMLSFARKLDMEARGATEADHIVCDMITRAERHGIATARLKVSYSRLQVHEAQRAD